MKTLLLAILFWLLPFSVFASETTWKWFTLPSGLNWYAPQIVEASVLPLTDTIKNYIRAVSNLKDIDAERVLKIARCESNFNPAAYNPKDTDGYPAYGIFQFKKFTFEGAGGSDIWDWREQTDLATNFMAKGLWRKWPTCSKI